MKTNKPVRIVLIEDNPADVVLLRHALDAQNFHYEMEVLDDGEKALRFVEELVRSESAPAPCALVLDVYLPGCDGLQVLSAIRMSPELSSMHIFALSSDASPDDQERLRDLGARYRKKPSRIEGLLKLGEEIIAACRSPKMADY